MERIIVTNFLPSGVGFGVRLKGGASVYIPSYAGPVKEHNVSQEVMATIVPNAPGHSTPWKASYVDWEGRIEVDETEEATELPIRF